MLAPDDLRRAIGSDDVKTLTRVPGIGQKGAQRIILELKDRIGPARGGRPPRRSRPPRRGVTRSTRGSSGSAGPPGRRGRRRGRAPEAGDTPDVGTLLRAALRTLSRA